jgi:hypothetical protein
MPSELSWKKLLPMVQWLLERKFITRGDFYEAFEALMNNKGYKHFPESGAIYKWFDGSVKTLRPIKGAIESTEALAVESILICVKNTKPEHLEDVRRALYDQNFMFLKLIDGQGFPLPDQCIVPNPGIDAYTGKYYCLFRVGLSKDGNSWELKQVPFRIYRKENAVIYDEYFKSDKEYVGNGYVYLLGYALTIFMHVQIEEDGQEYDNLFFGSFLVHRMKGQSIGRAGYAGVFVASDDVNFLPASHKAVLVRSQAVDGIKGEFDESEGSWLSFRDVASRAYPLLKGEGGFELSKDTKFDDDAHKKNISAYISYLNFGKDEISNGFLYARYKN